MKPGSLLASSSLPSRRTAAQPQTRGRCPRIVKVTSASSSLTYRKRRESITIDFRLIRPPSCGEASARGESHKEGRGLTGEEATVR